MAFMIDFLERKFFERDISCSDDEAIAYGLFFTTLFEESEFESLVKTGFYPRMNWKETVKQDFAPMRNELNWGFFPLFWEEKLKQPSSTRNDLSGELEKQDVISAYG